MNFTTIQLAIPYNFILKENLLDYINRFFSKINRTGLNWWIFCKSKIIQMIKVIMRLMIQKVFLYFIIFIILYWLLLLNIILLQNFFLSYDINGIHLLRNIFIYWYITNDRYMIMSSFQKKKIFLFFASQNTD